MPGGSLGSGGFLILGAFCGFRGLFVDSGGSILSCLWAISTALQTVSTDLPPVSTGLVARQYVQFNLWNSSLGFGRACLTTSKSHIVSPHFHPPSLFP